MPSDSCPSRGPAIGIDLGTNYSRVGVFRNDRVEIIAKIPTCVTFTEEEILSGDDGVEYPYLEAKVPSNTICYVKRLIGRKFDEPVVQAELKYWPFKIMNADSQLKIQVEHKGEKKYFLPEEICSLILAKLKQIAESKMSGKIIQDAIITVPSHFNYLERRTIERACLIAGLKVTRIMSDTAVAAIAYGYQDKDTNKNETTGSGEHHVLVFSLGGGYLDVSILTIEDGIVEVRAIAGDSHLGGEDFTNRMIELFKSENTKDTSIGRMKTACDIAKLTLSTEPQASFLCDDVSLDITREKFEEINDDLFRKVLEPVEKALGDAKMSKSELNNIILVGGSTHIPKIQQIIQDYFPGKELKSWESINPDEAVAYGAAIYAAVLHGEKSEKLDELLLVDATTFSFGIEMVGGGMVILTKRDTAFPAKETRIFTTCSDNQTKAIIKIFEGELPIAKDNNFLGKLEITDIPPGPRGTPEIAVSFDIDANDILSVTVIARVDKSIVADKRITITQLSKEESINNGAGEDDELFAVEPYHIRRRESESGETDSPENEGKNSSEKGRMNMDID